MALTYMFSTPVTCGAYPNQFSVASVRLASVSFNFEAAKIAEVPSICAASIVLEDTKTGQKISNPQFADAYCLALVRTMLAATNPATGHTFEADLLARAVAATDPVSGKTMVPAGTAA